MNLERVLALDISTKTGFSYFFSNEDGSISLKDYGQIDKIECPEGFIYPTSYVEWAHTCYLEIHELITTYAPDVLVVEETTRSKNSFSQKILEFIHYLTAKLISDIGIKCIYLQTGEWRKEIGSYMNVAEKKRNKEVKAYKDKNKTTIAYDINGKRIGKVTKKHVTIRLVNEVFKDQLKKPLRRKDEDQADAIAIGFAYHKRRTKGLYG